MITGSTGILGQQLSITFAEGNDILACNRQVMDITDRKQVFKTVNQFGPDVIIHAAAFTNVEAAERDSDLAFAVNVFGTQNLVESTQGANPLFVYISSTGNYGVGRKDTPYTELDLVCPTTQYHLSKYQGEKVVHQHISRFLILRTGWLFGGDVLQTKNFVYKRFLEAQGKKVLYSDPNQSGSPTCVVDFSAQIRYLVEQKCLGVYNCVNEGVATRLEYVKKIIEYYDLPCEVLPIRGGRFKRVAAVSPNESAYNYNLNQRGLNIMHAWQESLQRYIATIS